MKQFLFKNQTTDGDGPEVVLKDPGDKYIMLSGDPDGGTVRIDIKTADGQWVPIEGGSFTEAIARLFRMIPASSTIRANLNGAGGGADVTVEIA